MSEAELDAEIEAAIRKGAASALRTRAEAQSAKARVGTTHPDNFSDVSILTGEAAIAARQAEAFMQIASDLEGGK